MLNGRDKDTGLGLSEESIKQNVLVSSGSRVAGYSMLYFIAAYFLDCR